MVPGGVNPGKRLAHLAGIAPLVDRVVERIDGLGELLRILDQVLTLRRLAQVGLRIPAQDSPSQGGEALP